MNDPESPKPHNHPVIRAHRRRVPSLVWLLPAVTGLASLSLFIHMLMEQGPEIQVRFRTAEGLVAGQTHVRYKAVDIGLVNAVHLAPDRLHVVATIRLSKDAENFLVKDTRFWIVRPRFAVSGISGLETLLSGAYIGIDPGTAHVTGRSFTGLETPPGLSTDAEGKQLMLTAADLGSLDIGSPVYYRRMQVGQVVSYRLTSNGRALLLRIFINKPYDKLVTTDTRFWHASGVDIKLDADGVKITTQALATLVTGGIAFQAPDDVPATAEARENTAFTLAGNMHDAMQAPEERAPALVVLNFDQSVRGLAPGAPVDFRGIVVGQVRSIGVEYRRDKKSFRLPVVVALYPSRVGLSVDELADKAHARDIAETMNRRGLRAQLRTSNLLTGQLYVALDFFPGAPRAMADLDGRVPELATVPGTLDELQAKVGNIVNKIDKVPFEKIGHDMRSSMMSLEHMLASTDALVANVHADLRPQFTATLQETRRTLQSAHAALDPASGLQQDAGRTMQELTRAAISLRNLSDYLERHPESLIRGKSSGMKQETP